MTAKERNELRTRFVKLFWAEKADHTPLQKTEMKMHNYGIVKCISELTRTPTDAQKKRGYKYRSVQARA
jgi:hypothetical protein